jgi:hypothetical protein
MAIHWQIPFKSLRGNTDYCVNIIDAAYSGSPVVLKGAAQPFTTDEDSNEDMFTPIRTQSGYLRIVDDGKDASGNAFNWKTFIPSTDTSRPVTLTKKVGTAWQIVWQGFMQTQNFGHRLYGNPQEMEFPVQCCLSVLNSMEVSTEATQLHNFAWILYNFLVTNMPEHAFTQFVVQGGADAQAWLLKKVDWQTFLRETEENDLEPAYTHYEVIEDVCRFWGWTIRTKGQTVYLTCMDDAAEQSLLTMTQANLQTMAVSETNAGTISQGISTVTLSGDIFASDNNDSFQNRGPNKATVKASVKEHDVILECLPPSVDQYLNDTQWSWHQSEGEDLVGYFESGKLYKFGTGESGDPIQSAMMKGYCNGTNAYFSRRQVYSTTDTDNAEKSDMICINHAYTGTQFASVQTKKPMTFPNGSLKLDGTVYFDDKICDWERRTHLTLRLGIGMTRETASWWYMRNTWASDYLDYGWSAGTVVSFNAPVLGGSIKSTGFTGSVGTFFRYNIYDAIPTPSTGLYGYLFIDILGLFSEEESAADFFQIADFKVTFSRDVIVLPTNIHQVRSRELVEERISSKEYTSQNPSTAKYEWNADCILASDNNFVYGFGLVMNADGTFMTTTQYGNSQANQQHPEQHLANRVTTYWQTTRRRLSVELRTNAITEPAPSQKVTIDGNTFHPIAISHDWRDDITKLTLMQL